MSDVRKASSEVASTLADSGIPARILLVDDNDDIRGLARLMIELDLCIRHEVIEASNGVDALRVCTASRPNVMVLDLNLPWISGLDVLRAVRMHPKAPCVIAWSADPFALQTAMALGAAQTLNKTRNLEDLIEAIEECLG